MNGVHMDDLEVTSKLPLAQPICCTASLERTDMMAECRVKSRLREQAFTFRLIQGMNQVGMLDKFRHLVL